MACPPPDRRLSWPAGRFCRAYGSVWSSGVLGPLEVYDASGVVAIGSRLQRRLLVALLVEAGTVVSADRLVDILSGPASLRPTNVKPCGLAWPGSDTRWPT